MHQKLSGEHKNFYLFSQKRKCATARLKLLISKLMTPPDSYWKEGRDDDDSDHQFTAHVIEQQWRLQDVTGQECTACGCIGGGAHSFVLFLLRSCTVPEDQVQPRNERANQPTTIFSNKLCLPRPQARGWLEAEAVRDPCLLTPSMISSYLVYD